MLSLQRAIFFAVFMILTACGQNSSHNPESLLGGGVTESGSGSRPESVSGGNAEGIQGNTGAGGGGASLPQCEEGSQDPECAMDPEQPMDGGGL